MKPKSGITCSARNPSVRRTLPDRVRSYTRPARSAVAPTWAGKPMPRGTGFPARGVGTGRTPSAIRPAPSHPILAPFALLCGQPSAVRPPSSALRPPASAFPSSIRFLRLLRFFAANPPLSVLSRPPSVFRRQPSHPILAPFAPLCGQSPSTRFPPVSSDQTPFQTHPHSAPAERSSLLKSLLYKAPFVPAHVAHVGRRKLDSGFGHKLRVIGPVDLACIGPAPNRRPAGMLAPVRTHHFD